MFEQVPGHFLIAMFSGGLGVKVPGYFAAFLAGLLSFLTPCVLPLVPGYISFISGVSLTDLKAEDEAARQKLWPVIGATLAFSVGFSLVFIAGGLTAFALGQAILAYKDWLMRGAGLVIIILGLHMAGVFRIQRLYQEKRFQGGTGGSLPRAFVLGLAFAFGWTPCVGPILGGILTLAARQDQIGQALALMVLYSLGLALPFLLTGLMVDTFFKFFDRIKNHFHKIEIAAGALLILIGLTMVINRFEYLKMLFQWVLPESVGTWG